MPNTVYKEYFDNKCNSDFKIDVYKNWINEYIKYITLIKTGCLKCYDTLISIWCETVGHNSFRRALPPWLIVQYPAILQSGNGNLGKMYLASLHLKIYKKQVF